MMDVPKEFFQCLSDDEWQDLCEHDGRLNRKLCRRLWRMLGRTDPPPHQLLMLLDREDVMRMFPPRDKQH